MEVAKKAKVSSSFVSVFSITSEKEMKKSSRRSCVMISLAKTLDNFLLMTEIVRVVGRIPLLHHLLI